MASSLPTANGPLSAMLDHKSAMPDLGSLAVNYEKTVVAPLVAMAGGWLRAVRCTNNVAHYAKIDTQPIIIDTLPISIDYTPTIPDRRSAIVAQFCAVVYFLQTVTDILSATVDPWANMVAHGPATVDPLSLIVDVLQMVFDVVSIVSAPCGDNGRSSLSQ